MTASGDNPFEAMTLDALRRRTSIKWRHYPREVLPLWVAEMDVEVAPAVRRAITRAIQNSDTGYAVPADYVAAFSSFATDTWGWNVDVDQCMVMPDVMQGVTEIVRMWSAPGDPVIVNPPVYPPFYDYVRHTQRSIVEVALGSDLRLDTVALEAAFADLSGRFDDVIYLLCSPHNPTGTVHSEAELHAVGQLANRYGIHVVADEIHAPLVLDGAAFTPYSSVDTVGITLHSASKGWNLAGMKAALAVAGPDSTDDLHRISEVVTHGISHFGVTAHVAAWTEGREWLASVRAGLISNRTLLGDLLASHLPTVGYLPGQATYLAWLDCAAVPVRRGPTVVAPVASEPMMDLTGAAELFYDHGVALAPGAAFGTGGADHVRLNFATAPTILTEAVHRMAGALDQ